MEKVLDREKKRKLVWERTRIWRPKRGRADEKAEYAQDVKEKRATGRTGCYSMGDEEWLRDEV